MGDGGPHPERRPSAEMPIDFDTRFVLEVDLKGAKEIGVEIPPEILVRADRIHR